MSDTDELRDLIDARIVEAKNEMAALRAARAALSNEHPTGTSAVSAASKHTPPAKPRRPAQRKPRSSRGPVEVLLAGKLETMLSVSAAGLSAGTVSKRANARYRQVLTLLRELEQAGRVRHSGTGRTSLWRVVTDEERIAERAAELERRSSRSRGL
jgi:hypothetical protein